MKTAMILDRELAFITQTDGKLIMVLSIALDETDQELRGTITKNYAMDALTLIGAIDDSLPVRSSLGKQPKQKYTVWTDGEFACFKIDYIDRELFNMAEVAANIEKDYRNGVL